MDVATEMTYAVPAMIFSVLAIILAAIFLKMKLAIPKDQDANKSDDATDGAKISEQPEGDAKTADGEQTKTSKDAEPAEIKKGEDVNVKEEKEASAAATDSRDSGDVKGKAGGDKLVVEEIGAEDGGNLKTDVGKVGESEEQSHPRQEDNATVNREERESEAETGGSVQASPEPVDGDDHDDDDDDDEEEYKVNLKYSPGKMRASQYETLMTREEQEQEQRVQREQLTAIFKLLEENKDTFGEMSDVDVEEQLKLYAI
ncbi:FILIA-N KH-like domain-containing protein isoform X1 [Acipenser oxyrinchus oxyrinchus]|uniref:FILIA-N KH-like domain-containing protein isoform X1 n=1 Tax=Acipenser oxyrinchus oxyrinchus TaxID=40147 RepID=A0AAD8G163_ACIOX|nr:FILIA-N KH-like domain-containing protein isoform X1 [Acipenser oxyrinchus oxyrinchus]